MAIDNRRDQRDGSLRPAVGDAQRRQLRKGGRPRRAAGRRATASSAVTARRWRGTGPAPAHQPSTADSNPRRARVAPPRGQAAAPARLHGRRTVGLPSTRQVRGWSGHARCSTGSKSVPAPAPRPGADPGPPAPSPPTPGRPAVPPAWHTTPAEDDQPTDRPRSTAAAGLPAAGRPPPDMSPGHHHAGSASPPAEGVGRRPARRGSRGRRPPPHRRLASTACSPGTAPAIPTRRPRYTAAG